MNKPGLIIPSNFVLEVVVINGKETNLLLCFMNLNTSHGARALLLVAVNDDDDDDEFMSLMLVT